MFKASGDYESTLFKDLGAEYFTGGVLRSVMMPVGGPTIPKPLKSTFPWLISGPAMINLISILSSVCRPVDFP